MSWTKDSTSKVAKKMCVMVCIICGDEESEIINRLVCNKMEEGHYSCADCLARMVTMQCQEGAVLRGEKQLEVRRLLHRFAQREEHIFQYWCSSPLFFHVGSLTTFYVLCTSLPDLLWFTRMYGRSFHNRANRQHSSRFNRAFASSSTIH